MIEKNGHFEIELSDVLEATDLGTDHIVDDWPWGRKQKLRMHFFVEPHPKRGERFMRQSTFRGRIKAVKKSTYTSRATIIELDGKIGHVEFNQQFVMFEVDIEDGKYWSKTFHGSDAVKLFNHFFK